MKVKPKVGGKNEFHLTYTQLFRKSNSAGFHCKNKKQKNKSARREAKQNIKNFIK